MSGAAATRERLRLIPTSGRQEGLDATHSLLFSLGQKDRLWFVEVWTFNLFRNASLPSSWSKTLSCGLRWCLHYGFVQRRISYLFAPQLKLWKLFFTAYLLSFLVDCEVSSIWGRACTVMKIRCYQPCLACHSVQNHKEKLKCKSELLAGHWCATSKTIVYLQLCIYI